MRNLKIPMAKDADGSMIQPEKASKKNQYYCPECNNQIVFRYKEGGRNIAHFSHPANSTCTNESILHKTAKLLASQIINGFLNGKNDSPVIERTCRSCNSVTEQIFEDRYDKAVIEKRLNSGFIADVAIESNGAVEAVVEIKVTHAVSEYKQQEMGVPFIELAGEELVADPMRWKPILDQLPSFACKKCEQIKKAYWKRLVDVSRRTNVVLPKEYYRTAIYECYNCERGYLIFDWPGRGEDESDPKGPRPKTLQLRYSNTVKRKYWANTCPHCNSFLGEFYQPDLLSEFSDDSIQSYRSDMKSLALRFVNNVEEVHEMSIALEPKSKSNSEVTLPYKNILMQRGIVKFKCVSCGETWRSNKPSDTTCPNCNEYIYTTIEN